MYKQANTAMSVDGKYEYEELEDGTIEITGYSGTERAITIPAQIDGKKVKGIGIGAFYKNSVVRNIKISNGIEYINYDAFGNCYNVRRIEIPESIIDISSTFWNCTNLKEIKVDSSNKNFVSEDGILFNKEKTEILKYPSGKIDEEYIIPNGVTTIGVEAFRGAYKLSTIKIPDGVTTIRYGAFVLCQTLRNIELPESIIEIGNCAFESCYNLKSIKIPENIKNNEEVIIGNFIFDLSYIIQAINIENTSTQEVELPSIIKCAIDENDIFYSGEGVHLHNCELSEDKSKLLVDIEALKDENAGYAYLEVNSGKLKDLRFEIVPSGTISWSRDVYSYNAETMAIINITEDETIINNGGKETYIFSKNGEFTFEYRDKNGNIKTSLAKEEYIPIYYPELYGEKVYITEIQPNTTAKDLMENILFIDSLNVKIYDGEQEVNEETILATGMKIIIEDEDEDFEYPIIVKGDIDKNGKVDINDLAKINAQRLNKRNLDEIGLIAGDVDNSGIIDLGDLIKMNRYRLHKSTEL